MLIGKIPFWTHIATNWEESVREAENATEEIVVFTDGSTIEGKVGAVATLLR
jgi:hypothetical protein